MLCFVTTLFVHCTENRIHCFFENCFIVSHEISTFSEDELSQKLSDDSEDSFASANDEFLPENRSKDRMACTSQLAFACRKGFSIFFFIRDDQMII